MSWVGDIAASGRGRALLAVGGAALGLGLIGLTIAARPDAAGRMPRRRDELGSDGDGVLRVMTWNIKAAHGEHDLGTLTPEERLRQVDLLAAEIRSSDPDVVLLQEVENGFDRNGAAMEFDRLVAGVDATDSQFGAGTIGTAIITRNGVSISDLAVGAGNVVADHRLGRSSAMAVPLELPGGARITAVNVHVDPVTLALLGNAYLDPISRGALGPRQSPLPSQVILGGDFNETGAAVEDVVAPWGLIDAQTQLGIPTSSDLRRTTYQSFATLPDRDHLLLDPSIGTAHATWNPAVRAADGTALSDHRPLITDIALR